MDLMVLCLMLVPLLLFFISMFSGGKGTRLIVAVSGIFFLICTLVMFIIPNLINVAIPVLLWRILLLLTVFFIFLRSIRDKHYIISVLTFIQAIILVLFEIIFSPGEPERFLYINYKERLLLLLGAVVIISFIPFIFYYLKKYSDNPLDKLKQFSMGFVLLLSSFAGLISAKSMTGLFLFWQLQYISGYLLLKIFGYAEEKKTFPKIISYIQQAALVLFLSVTVVAYEITGSLAMEDFILGFGKISELMAFIIFMSAIIMGLLIPENYIPWFDSSRAVPIAGLYLIIFSLIVPYGVLLKFHPLFQELFNGAISLMVLYGSLLVFAGAYFALLYYKNRHSILSMIMCISGLAVATVFKGLQSGRDFLSANALPLLLVIAGIVLTVTYIIMRISRMFTHTSQTSGTEDIHMLTSLIPFNINLGKVIKIGWITTAALTLGVSLSCLK